MIGRRAFMQLAAAMPLAGRRKRSPVGWESNSVFQVLIIAGGGKSGLFAYSGRPSLGNLVASVAAIGGTDPFGNAYLTGVASYQPLAGPPLTAAALSGSTINQYTAPAAGGPWTQVAQISAGSGDLVLSSNRNISVPGNLISALSGLTVTGGITADTETISGSAAAAPLLQVTNAVADTSPLIRAQTVATAVAQLFFGGLLAGDSNSRLVLDADASGNPRIRFGPGNAAPDSFILRTGANALAVNGADLDINTIGRGLKIAEGANARMGLATLVAGTVTVANTTITGSTRIILTVQSAGGTQGFLRIAARTIGTSFTITSTSNTETSTVAWLLVEPG